MIRKNLLNFKLNLPETPLQKQFSEFMKKFNPALERCPSCGAKGQCRVFAYYERGIVEISGNRISFCIIRILRVICSCGHTHAIIPDFIVPFRRCSLPFILYILRLYFSHAMTIEKICAEFEISHSTIYRWKAIFLQHKDWWLDFVRSRRTTPSDFLGQICTSDPFSAFTSSFYQKTLYSFLQFHSNPANCRHLPPGWVFLEAPATRHVHSPPLVDAL
ncbi:MAG: DUF6431 domain-containing protein [Eubacteriales bacterium]|nr:DUF6431 domain-containing protein [Eubacteriales bacterium]